MSYDASVAPEPGSWLALAEDERIQQVLEYHEKLTDPHPSTPEPHAHAAFHVIVENQVALQDDTPVDATLDRLINEGLTRHDAIHAVGCVLAEHLHDVLHNEIPEADPHAQYFSALQELSAESWRNSG
jgi:hypothetical protein